MRMELATAPGDPHHPNEDYASLALPASGRGGTLVLLDGVTPPQDGDGCLHSVPWFTSRLGGALGELCVTRPDLALRDALFQAILRTADAHRATCDLSHPRTPQATVVLARWDEERVEHLVLSDSVLLSAAPDGRVEPILDDRLTRVPRSSLATVAVTDATLRNKEGGFFTAAADPQVAVRAVTGVRAREEVWALAALTDGAARWVEKFRQGDWSDCVALLHKEGPQALIDRVRALEESGGGASGASGGTSGMTPGDTSERAPGKAPGEIADLITGKVSGGITGKVAGEVSGEASRDASHALRGSGAARGVAREERTVPRRGKIHDDAAVIYAEL